MSPLKRWQAIASVPTAGWLAPQANTEQTEQALLVVPDLPYAALQYFEVLLDTPETGFCSLLIVIESPSLSDSVRDLVRRAVASASRTPVAFILSSSPGAADVLAPGGMAPAPVASAVAVVLANAAWDESPLIVVSVNGERLAVEARFESKVWQCRLAQDP